jgi:hypothetical protein
VTGSRSGRFRLLPCWLIESIRCNVFKRLFDFSFEPFRCIFYKLRDGRHNACGLGHNGPVDCVNILLTQRIGPPMSETAFMPDGRDRTDRINHDIPDISSMDQLLRYAAASQLEHVANQQKANYGRVVLTQGEIAALAGFGKGVQSAGVNLSAALRNGLDPRRLPNLDEIIGALAADLDGSGGLSSLALRLSGEGDAELKRSMTARVPPSWTEKLLQDPPGGDAGVLIQASALLSAFIWADESGAAGSVARIRDRYSKELGPLVKRLILISAEPPTSRNYEAQVILGILASYAFGQVQEILDYALHFPPLGFRVWRAITKLVRLGSKGEHAEALRSWVRLLVMDAEKLRKSSLYAGRGLDLELAISVPDTWSPPGHDWAGDALLTRAREHDATIRERGTAVMGLWQRAIRRRGADQEQTERDLRELINEFRDGSSRPDAAAGLEWIAATLEHVMDGREPVCKKFPEVDQHWFRCVQDSADEITVDQVPEHLLKGTRNLFRHMLLQNAGVYRRQAIETVVTSGWNEPVASALGLLLKNETGESWLRVRADFALGLMQKQSWSVQKDLTAACRHAFGNLQAAQDGPDGKPALTHIREMQASLFAVGDCFGVAGAADRAQRIRANIEDVLTYLAEMDPGRGTTVREAARAAAYALMMTAQPSQPGGPPDLSKVLLEKLSAHSDPVTADLSKWALGFRFADNGAIRPLLDAPLGA